MPNLIIYLRIWKKIRNMQIESILVLIWNVEQNRVKEIQQEN